MFEIREMTGQQYKDVYATKKAEDLPAEPAKVITAADLVDVERALSTVG